MKELFINSYCHIKNNRIFVDGKLLYSDKVADSLSLFAKSGYRYIKPSYNKFFKMDEISKLGFLAAEVLLSGVNLTVYNEEDIAVILSNSHSTLVTDLNHQLTIDDYNNFFPSPSLFVYTLPNIMIGEISIRHKLRGENAFFIVENFKADIITNHINSLYLAHKANAFVGGWVNQSENDYEAFLYWVSNEGNILHNAFEINKLYNLIY
ncbi:MAG: 3-oxoacyl-ACP synthase [Bacteroidetes bacterium]|nr:3-oxoacyl-ACP synthase [Bacteroidota bacterium]MBL6943270.1 3-oxoacyl-ACP synthase [Bacteroidales bacterium]